MDDLDISRTSQKSKIRWSTSNRPPSHRRGLTVACEEDVDESEFIKSVCKSIGLYMSYPLAQALLEGEKIRENILRKNCSKQINHVKSTDGWIKSMLVLEPRAIDNYFAPWIIIVLNAAICTVLSEVKGVNFENEILSHWDTVYTVVLKTSLAFLLVFRLNRVAIRYWETRTMWGNLTLTSRALVSGILLHLEENSVPRDRAIAWVGAYAIACMHFIRNDQEIPTEELWGFLTRPDIERMLDSQHAPLYAATQIRRNLKKALRVSPTTLPALAHARAVQMNLLEVLINDLIAQVSGMEKIRSTPLPIVYVAHLRTFLFLYLLSIPYIYVGEWGWATIGLVGFTAFALLGIEGASTECEVPFNKSRCNHLALDAYCLIILENIQGLVVQDANMDMVEKQNSTEKDDIHSHDHPFHGKTGSFDIASCINEVIPDQN